MIVSSLKFLNCPIYLTVGDFINISEKSRTVSAKPEGTQFASLKWSWVSPIK